jgi:hypothetical protein
VDVVTLAAKGEDEDAVPDLCWQAEERRLLAVALASKRESEIES